MKQKDIDGGEAKALMQHLRKLGTPWWPFNIKGSQISPLCLPQLLEFKKPESKDVSKKPHLDSPAQMGQVD